MGGDFKQMPDASALSSQEQDWIDWYWSWLTQHFGSGAAKSIHVIRSTSEILRIRRQLTTGDAQSVFENVGKAMGFNMQASRLFVRDILSPDDHAELDQQIEAVAADGHLAGWVSPDYLASPDECIALIAKQVVLARLAIGTRIHAEGSESAAIGELGAVYLGAGVILANIAVVDASGRDGLQTAWRVQRNTCMTIPMFGYALARLAHHRVEKNPEWAASLKPEVRMLFKQALHRFDATSPRQLSINQPIINPFTVEAHSREDEDDWDVIVSDIEHELKSMPQGTVYCVTCGYNLATLKPGQCPECGSVFDPEDLNTVSSDPPLHVPEGVKALAWLSKKILLLVIASIAAGGILLALYIFFTDIL